jgi:P-type Cu2+ transporter
MTHVVLEASGLLRGSSAPALEAFLRRQPGIHDVEANTTSQTVTVGYDETRVTEAELRRLIEECGYHCAGRIMPRHVCAPEPGVAGVHRPPPLAGGHAGHAMPAEAPPVTGGMARIAHEMGHGGAMSMEGMVADMRRRFWVTFALAIVVTLYSPMATELFGIRLPPVPGIPTEVLLFLVSTPAVLWGGQVFFVGAYRALRNRTLDMSVLIALSVGTGYLFSVAATFLFRGEVFYEASVVLLAFVLFGHWMEMRARAGASDAMRALLDLAPPKATVIRNGAPVEVPTSEVLMDDVVLIRPGDKMPVDGIVLDGESSVDESMITARASP